MNRPLISVVLAYAAGLLIGQFLQIAPLLLFVSAFSILTLALIFSKLRPHLLWPLLVLTGWMNFSVHTQIISPQDLRTQLTDKPALVTVRGFSQTVLAQLAARSRAESAAAQPDPVR